MVCYETDKISKLRSYLPIDWSKVQPFEIVIMKTMEPWLKLSEPQIKNGETLLVVNQGTMSFMWSHLFGWRGNMFTMPKEEETDKNKIVTA